MYKHGSRFNFWEKKLKVLESFFLRICIFLSGEPSTTFTHVQQRQIVIANRMLQNAQPTLT